MIDLIHFIIVNKNMEKVWLVFSKINSLNTFIAL